MSEINWLEPSVWEKMKISKAEAKKQFEKLNEDNLEPIQLKNYEKQLREALVKSIDEARAKLVSFSSKPELYDIDLYTGLTIYEVLNTKFAFNERLAAQDDIWRYISIRIIPDIIYKRHGLKSGRYYEHPRRVWLKALWWYVHLSWQGTIDDTFKILEHNTTDFIVQLVERTGLNGYRVDFTRKLMKNMHEKHKDLPGTQKTSLFRRVLKLSTARTKIIEPSLVEGGTDSYVKGLFEYFVKTS